jgi:membrane protein
VPGAVLGFAVFFGGAAGLRSYITFIVRQSHAYGTLAGPIAALLFLFILALGVLLGAEFNAAIEWMWPSRVRRPRALHPRRWIRLEKEQPSSGPEPVAQSADPPWPPDPIVRPTDPVTRPAEPTGRPTEPDTQPSELTGQPADPVSRPTAEPIRQPDNPDTRPAEPTGQPADPAARPAGPITPAHDSRANGVAEPSRPSESKSAARVESPVGSGLFRFGRRRRQPSDPPPGGRLS